jgi:acetylornithine/N-succinyldiaminopimelate aminotransferase
MNAETMPGDPLMRVADRPPVVFVRGHGSWLIDDRGREYLDFVQGWAVNCLGHAHPAMVRAITAQAQTLINASPGFYTDRLRELAAKLVALSCMDRVFFTNSGAEANEGAIKLARKWGGIHRGGAFEIITLRNGFHGRTLATMSASGKPQWERLFEPKVPGFVKVPVGDLDAVEQAITPDTVAVMLEPIQGEAGVIPMPDGYLPALRDLTSRRNLLLILDEIQTGIGRTGTMFAYQQAGIEPDIMTLGKGLGGGVPLGALTAKEAVCCFEPGDQGGTFNGNALVCAVGAAVLDTVGQPEFLDEVAAKGRYLAAGLAGLSQRFGHGEVRGAGLLLGWALKDDAAGAIASGLLARGMLLNAPRPNTLRFMPALTVTREEIDRAIALLGEAMADRS